MVTYIKYCNFCEEKIPYGKENVFYDMDTGEMYYLCDACKEMIDDFGDEY